MYIIHTYNLGHIVLRLYEGCEGMVLQLLQASELALGLKGIAFVACQDRRLTDHPTAARFGFRV